MELLYQTIAQYIEKRYLILPERCQYGNDKIHLFKLTLNKISPFCSQCSRKNCKKIFPLLDRSFF